MIESFIRLDDPSSLKATMEITMSVSSWRALKRQIAPAMHTYSEPYMSFGIMVENLIQQVEGQFDFDTKVEGE